MGGLPFQIRVGSHDLAPLVVWGGILAALVAAYRTELVQGWVGRGRRAAVGGRWVYDRSLGGKKVGGGRLGVGWGRGTGEGGGLGGYGEGGGVCMAGGGVRVMGAGSVPGTRAVGGGGLVRGQTRMQRWAAAYFDHVSNLGGVGMGSVGPPGGAW